MYQTTPTTLASALQGTVKLTVEPVGVPSNDVPQAWPYIFRTNRGRASLCFREYAIYLAYTQLQSPSFLALLMTMIRVIHTVMVTLWPKFPVFTTSIRLWTLSDIVHEMSHVNCETIISICLEHQALKAKRLIYQNNFRVHCNSKPTIICGKYAITNTLLVSAVTDRYML